MEISRQNARAIENRINEVLGDLSKELGLSVVVSLKSIGHRGLEGKVLVSGLQDGEALSLEALDFQRYAERYGLNPGDLHREFRVGDEAYKIVGLRTRAPKRPILAERVGNGKVYVLDAETVRRSIGLQRTQEAILEELRDIENALSPENLSGDGEFPRSYVQKRSRELQSRRRELINELGREPTTQELYPGLLS